MRSETRKKIDDLNRQIDMLVEEEKQHHVQQNPGQPGFMREIAYAKIELQAFRDKESLRTSVLAFPR